MGSFWRNNKQNLPVQDDAHRPNPMRPNRSSQANLWRLGRKNLKRSRKNGGVKKCTEVTAVALTGRTNPLDAGVGKARKPVETASLAEKKSQPSR